MAATRAVPWWLCRLDRAGSGASAADRLGPQIQDQRAADHPEARKWSEGRDQGRYSEDRQCRLCPAPGELTRLVGEHGVVSLSGTCMPSHSTSSSMSTCSRHRLGRLGQDADRAQILT